MASVEIEAVRVYKGLVEGLLDRATQVKPEQIEPPLTEGLLGDRIWQVPEQEEATVKQLNQQTQFAAVEIAFREKFYHLLVPRAYLGAMTIERDC
jgi:THO complex subunit 1